VLLASLAVPAGAQQNMLLGVWRSSQPATQFGPANTVTLSFQADGRYQFQQAFASRGDGTASGTLTAVGVFRFAGPNRINWQVHSAQLCAAGSSCSARPDMIKSGFMEFSFQGPGRMISGGTVFFRIG
jgi:hypothetical protein